MSVFGQGVTDLIAGLLQQVIRMMSLDYPDTVSIIIALVQLELIAVIMLQCYLQTDCLPDCDYEEFMNWIKDTWCNVGFNTHFA